MRLEAEVINGVQSKRTFCCVRCARTRSSDGHDQLFHMPSKVYSKLRWRLGVLAALALALLSIYPQFDLWRTTGARAPYVSLWFDEACYSAYVNSLVEGRPRRNDPFIGRMDAPDSPYPETIFSIQFIPPYLLASSARLFGISASTVFILLAPIAAFASALALFWLLGLVTGDDRVACAGSIFVLCLGSLAAKPVGLWLMLHLRNPFTLLEPFPFMRRYVPAVPFPFFLVLCALVWRALVCESERASIRHAILAGLVFAVLVFSYFFLWTAALAWLTCFAALWLVFRPEGRRRALLVFGVIGVLALIAFVPYALLLSHRGATTDLIQRLTSTRAPDLFRPTELIGAFIFMILIAAALKGVVKWRDGAWLFAASCALMPLVCFNQQLITGLSLQSDHYRWMSTNYLVLIAAVVTMVLLWRAIKGAGATLPRAFLVTLALASLGWGGVEIVMQSQAARQASVQRVQMQPVAARLRELARGLPAEQVASQVVLFTPSLLFVEANSLPTDAPQSVLLAPHTHVFGGTWPEFKERLYQNLYYAGFDRDKMDAFARAPGGHLRFAFFYYNPNPPPAETFPQWVVADYMAYVSSFNRERAAHPQLAYLVVATNDDADLTNLDRWYERDAGERIGNLILYRLKLRP